MKVNLRGASALVVTVLIPSSYDSLVAKMPQQLVSTSIDHAYEMRDYYNVEKKNFRYTYKLAEWLWDATGYYGFDSYSDCGKLLDSNPARRKAYELQLDSSCLLSFDTVTAQTFKEDPAGWKFFYWCLFSWKRATYCLSEYRPGRDNKQK